MRALAILILGAAPVLADSYALPQGCSGLLSVQQRDCTLTHYFRCDADPAGDMRRVDITQNGPNFETQTDAEGRWLDSASLQADGAWMRSVLGAEADPASLTELLEQGVDTFDFQTETDAGARRKYSGFDRLTGKTVTIDGETLQETAFSMTVTDTNGRFLWRSEGREYVSARLRVFISGRRTVSWPDGEEASDGSPVTFARPGEPGFLATRPEVGCALSVAQAPLADPEAQL